MAERFISLLHAFLGSGSGMDSTIVLLNVIPYKIKKFSLTPNTPEYGECMLIFQ